jgi:ribonuclease D
MTQPRFISKEDINKLPEFELTKEIILIERSEEAILALDEISKASAVGLDTETRPAFKKGESYDPALLQVATLEKVYLFRLQFFTWPIELIHFFENQNIIKVGVNIKDDAFALNKVHPFTPRGFIDVAYEAKLLQIENQGLRGLTALLLNQRLPKGTKLSNWERRELSPIQLKYAAIDAMASLLVYENLMQRVHL